MELRVCNRCREEKPATAVFFPRVSRHKLGVGYTCRACKADLARIRYESKRAEILAPRKTEAHRAAKRAWHARNSGRINTERRANYDPDIRKAQAEKHSERIKANRRQHWRAHKPTILKKRKGRYQTDGVFRLRCALSVAFRQTLVGVKKSASWVKIVGYDTQQLRTHLESQFEPWMSWDNYGSAWHVDHIRPIASFDLPAQIKECWALENLRPLSAEENWRKGARFPKAA